MDLKKSKFSPLLQICDPEKVTQSLSELQFLQPRVLPEWSNERMYIQKPFLLHATAEEESVFNNK